MNSIRKNAIQILDEQRKDIELLAYHNDSKENDPTYYAWLFPDSSNISDYGAGMTAEQSEEFELFEQSIISLQEIRDNMEL